VLIEECVPFPLLAHQAPILPLKAWRPDWFSGTALVIGSIAPDLEYLASYRPRQTGFGHSFAGQFFFCLPITVAIVLYCNKLRIGEALAPRLGLPFIQKAATGLDGSQGIFKVVTSALAGSFSHLALDTLTHRYAPRWLYFLGEWRWHGLMLNAASLAQLVLTALGSIITLVVLRRMLKDAEPAPAPRSDGRMLLMASAIVGAVLGGLRVRPAFRDPTLYFYAAHIYVWGHAIFHVACGIALAWLIVGGILSWRDMAVSRQPAMK
jgi:hypothetical protein